MNKSCNIRKFDLKSLPSDSVIVLIGKRRTGKSFCLREIMYHKRDIPAGIVISKTEKLNHFFEKFIPKLFIHEEYDPIKIKELLDRQEVALEEDWENKNSFLIMDDVLADAKSWSKDKYMKEIFFNGRHYNIFFVLTMQDPIAIPPGLRNNIDYTFIFKTNNMANIEKLYKQYAGVFPNLKTFKFFLDKCTEDNKIMIIDNVTTSSKIEDVVFYYKAEYKDNFRLFSDRVWEASERYFRNLKNENKEYISIKK